jgi:VCBS repeat-containing protein
MDKDYAALNYFIVDNPAYGIASLIDGRLQYVPQGNYNGSDSFTYKANDGVADSNIATVIITVNPANNAPVAAADTYRMKRNSTLEVPAPGVLANDQDIENGGLTITLVNGVSHGTLTLNSDGSFTYTPNPDFRGEDAFTYQISDPEGATSITTVTINVRK